MIGRLTLVDSLDWTPSFSATRRSRQVVEILRHLVRIAGTAAGIERLLGQIAVTDAASVINVGLDLDHPGRVRRQPGTTGQHVLLVPTHLLTTRPWPS